MINDSPAAVDETVDAPAPTPVRYFAFDGQFQHEVDGDWVPLLGNELEEVIEHVLHALNNYNDGRFEFVDVDCGGTLSNGRFKYEWNDYGL